MQMRATFGIIFTLTYVIYYLKTTFQIHMSNEKNDFIEFHENSKPLNVK